jgi:hypothetical protein
LNDTPEKVSKIRNGRLKETGEGDAALIKSKDLPQIFCSAQTVFTITSTQTPTVN